MINNSIFEDGNGGQLVLRNNEIIQTRSIATLAYLLMFGGNVEADTRKENARGELKFDWWGNDSTEPKSTWINSKTERTLKGIQLNSASRYIIIDAIKKDVKPLEIYGKVDVGVTFVSINKIKMVITISEPNNINDQSLTLVWNATRSEIIEKNII